MPLLVGAVVVLHLFLIMVWFSSQHWGYGNLTSITNPLGQANEKGDISEAAWNETLGFEKIFYISMPQYDPLR